jgi:hypothetical protein
LLPVSRSHISISPSSRADKHSRVLISQDCDEIHVTIAEYTHVYWQYLVCQLDDVTEAPFLKMHRFGPFSTKDPKHMKILPSILKIMLPYVAKATAKSISEAESRPKAGRLAHQMKDLQLGASQGGSTKTAGDPAQGLPKTDSKNPPSNNSGGGNPPDVSNSLRRGPSPSSFHACKNGTKGPQGRLSSPVTHEPIWRGRTPESTKGPNSDEMGRMIPSGHPRTSSPAHPAPPLSITHQQHGHRAPSQSTSDDERLRGGQAPRGNSSSPSSRSSSQSSSTPAGHRQRRPESHERRPAAALQAPRLASSSPLRKVSRPIDREC